MIFHISPNKNNFIFKNENNNQKLRQILSKFYNKLDIKKGSECR